PSSRIPTRLCTSQLSVAVVPWATVASHCPPSSLLVRFCVSSTCFSVSVTTTLKVLVCVFPCASVTVQVTAVVPTGKTEPETGLEVTEPTPGQLSVAVGLLKRTEARRGGG